MEKERLTVNIRPEVKKFLRQEALDKGVTVSRLIETIVEIIKANKK